MKNNNMVVTNVPGRCPYCGSFNIEYGSVELDGDLLSYPAECMECHKKYNEYYQLTYIESIGGDNE